MRNAHTKSDNTNSTAIRAVLNKRAQSLGLSPPRIANANLSDEAGARLFTFLDEGRHGTMTWLADTAQRRKSPTALWPDAKSAIVTGLNYGPATNPLTALQATKNGIISVYAKGRDYHDILKGKLKHLAQDVQRLTGAEVKVFVDTAPLMEKPLAAAAGLGWQGKHTNLVSQEFGSWLFLGTILTTALLEPDDASIDHCGSCQRCLEICPTDAFPAPYQLDARRCIAYLTIEHAGHIPVQFRKPMGNRIFGCDDCLAVCPWNKFAAASQEVKLAASQATDNPPLDALLSLDDLAFRKTFAGTPVKRTGRNKFMRNCLIAAGNAKDTALLPAITKHLNDASGLVRAMAVWALRQLGDADTVNKFKRAHGYGEADPHVQKEWNREPTT